MRKNLWVSGLGAAAALLALFGFAACDTDENGEETPHTHEWASEWSINDSEHWHACAGCDEKKDAEAHDFSNGACACGRELLSYALTADGNAYKVTGMNSACKDVVIPDEHNGKKVTAIGERAFAYTAIESVTIGSNLTKSESAAFMGCKSLEAVYISDLASWCKIDFANGSSNPLYGENSLCLNGEPVTELTIPDGVTEIAPRAFASCASIKSVTVPDSVTSLGRDAFFGCYLLQSVTLGNGVPKLDDYTFYACGALKSVSIGSGVNSIGENAFGFCYALQSIDLNMVTSFASTSFAYCSSLKSISANESNTKYAHQDGVLYNKEKTSVAFVPPALCGNVTVPQSVKTIGDWTFASRSALESVVLEGATAVGKGAFSGCSSLKSATFSTALTKLEEDAFSDYHDDFTIVYQGTKTQWGKVEKKGNSAQLKVQCTDGTLNA